MDKPTRNFGGISPEFRRNFGGISANLLGKWANLQRRAAHRRCKLTHLLIKNLANGPIYSAVLRTGAVNRPICFKTFGGKSGAKSVVGR